MPITKKMPSTMLPGHNFAHVPGVALPRSVFNMSRAYKTTFDAGNLIPIFLQEVLPGDSFHVVMSAFARLTTPIKPLMDNLRLFFWFFFVPRHPRPLPKTRSASVVLSYVTRRG